MGGVVIMGMALAENPLLNDVRNAVMRVSAQQHDQPFEYYSVKQDKIANLTIYSIKSDPVTVSRLPEDILADRVFDVLVHVQLEGTAIITQDGKSFILKEKALAIVPGGIPYSVTYPERGSKIILRIPYRVFHERLIGREVRDFGATQLEGGLVPIIISLLTSLTLGEKSRLTDIDQFMLAESFLSMIGSVICLRRKLGLKDNEKNHSARLCRILSYIEEHFSDHELTPSRIAKANFVSIRHLHGLFQQRGTTVSKWLWNRRLGAGREDLLDASKASMTICEIAYSRGFNDSAHFSRAFKDRFGVSPREFRTKASLGIPMND
jgi:AraC-like DNA-binding protein